MDRTPSIPPTNMHPPEHTTRRQRPDKFPVFRSNRTLITENTEVF
ncbi:hypothetical protein FMEAI12_3910004 [Parafrankia sp. Ea1.12]|nr:hypothetical protein FMEAI12_3910004 [Parafrankia sp. Ea1.12]